MAASLWKIQTLSDLGSLVSSPFGEGQELGSAKSRTKYH